MWLACESDWKELANNVLCNIQHEYVAQDDKEYEQEKGSTFVNVELLEVLE